MTASEVADRRVLAAIIDRAPCALLLTRRSGVILEGNGTLAQWIGRPIGELAGADVRMLLTPPSRLLYENRFFPLLHVRGRVTDIAFDLERPSREPMPVLASAVVLPPGDGVEDAVIMALFDATERRQHERDLVLSRRRAEQLAAIVEATTDAILLLSPGAGVISWNPGASALFGHSADAAVGRPVAEFVPALSDPGEGTALFAEMRAGRTAQLETTVRHRDGHRIDVSIALAPHLGSLGDLEAVSLIARDISAHRETERLQQEFLAMVGHELRNPLNAISTYAQLMRRRREYSESAVEAVERQAALLDRLVGDLLLASRAEADRLVLRPALMDLVAEVRTAVEAFPSDGRTVRIETSGRRAVVSADRQRIAQVVSNLVSNALKYSPARCEVDVRVAVEDGWGTVAVRDRGVGIAPDALPHVFERFYRAPGESANVPGIGLGLYVTRRIIEAHGGRIEVESELGRGSTFTVRLPLAGAEAPDPG